MKAGSSHQISSILFLREMKTIIMFLDFSIPRKKCKSPKSLRANSALKSFNNPVTALLDELVTIISTTYIRTNMDVLDLL